MADANAKRSDLSDVRSTDVDPEIMDRRSFFCADFIAPEMDRRVADDHLGHIAGVFDGSPSSGGDDVCPTRSCVADRIHISRPNDYADVTGADCAE